MDWVEKRTRAGRVSRPYGKTTVRRSGRWVHRPLRIRAPRPTPCLWPRPPSLGPLGEVPPQGAERAVRKPSQSKIEDDCQLSQRESQGTAAPTVEYAGCAPPGRPAWIGWRNGKRAAQGGGPYTVYRNWGAPPVQFRRGGACPSRSPGEQKRAVPPFSGRPVSGWKRGGRNVC